MGWLYYLHIKEKRFQDDQYKIVALVQSNPQTDALNSAYLAEVLDLSLDSPVNLYQFDVKEGIKTLLSNPLIKEASIKKILPGTLFVQYQMRTPIAYLGEYANTVLDDEGFLFPFRPFFTSKRLPTLYLGAKEEACHWGGTLKKERSLKIAFSILDRFTQLNQSQFRIKQLDVSKAEEECYGQREAIVVLEENRDDWQGTSAPQSLVYLRLNPEDYAQGLMNFNTLLETLLKSKKEQETILIDLRLPHLAFIKGSRYE